MIRRSLAQNRVQGYDDLIEQEQETARKKREKYNDSYFHKEGCVSVQC